MDQNETPPDRIKRRRRRLGATGLLAAGLLSGVVLAGSQAASAASSNSNTSARSASASSAAARTAPRPEGNPATVAHGPGETLVTGANLATLTAAAKDAVPGATVIRVETDSNGGAVYEAHMQKADGSYVTVQFDKNLKVTGTVDGFGPGGPPPGTSA